MFRQSDEEFIGHLNDVRLGTITPETTIFFHQYVRSKPQDEQPTELYARNADVNRRNAEELAKLPTDLCTYLSADEGSEWAINFLTKNCIAPTELDLKVGARVMMLKNNPKKQLVNGSLGTVVKTDLDKVIVAFRIHGELENVKIEAESWEYVARGRTEATRTQIPLRLAYAQTIHKAQGQTLSAAYIDLNAVFAEGHGYTALSRVANKEGLFLRGFNSFMVKTNPRTVEMYQMIAKKEPGFCLAKIKGSVAISEDYTHAERPEDKEDQKETATLPELPTS